MKYPVCIVVFLVLLFSADGRAADRFTLQLRWAPQAQFVGYYVAKAKGYYKDSGLDVTIRAGGPDIVPVKALASGEVDLAVEWLPSALAARERGTPLVNVAQVFNRSGQMLTCRASKGISRPTDLKGKRIGVWYGGLEYPFLNWMNKLGFKLTGPTPDVTAVAQGFSVDPLVKGEVDCISTMIYNEFWQTVLAGVNPVDLVSFQYEDQGVATLEDGLYALDTRLADKEFVGRMERFVRASIEGWRYALVNRDEAIQILLKEAHLPEDRSGFQLLQLKSIAKLINNPTGQFGRMSPDSYRRTVNVLLQSGGERIITRDPGSAGYSDIVWNSGR